MSRFVQNTLESVVLSYVIHFDLTLFKSVNRESNALSAFEVQISALWCRLQFDVLRESAPRLFSNAIK